MKQLKLIIDGSYRWKLQNKQQATKELSSNLTLFWFISTTAAVDITS